MVGLYSTPVSVLLSGTAAAPSAKRTCLLLRSAEPPASDIRTTLAPFGPTTMMSRSSGFGCVTKNVTVIDSMTPSRPLTFKLVG